MVSITFACRVCVSCGFVICQQHTEKHVFSIRPFVFARKISFETSLFVTLADKHTYVRRAWQSTLYSERDLKYLNVKKIIGPDFPTGLHNLCGEKTNTHVPGVDCRGETPSLPIYYARTDRQNNERTCALRSK